LEADTRAADELMEEEDGFESASIAPIADPRRVARLDPSSTYGRSNSKISSQDLSVLKMRFPRLREFSDEFLQARSMEELLKIESTSLKVKDAERKGDIEDRLAVNKQNLEANAVKIMSGSDDRWSILHPARFLAGAACSSKKVWCSARSSIDVNGHPPVANYDLTSVGLGGFVTSKGWIELHNPGSTKMALKLFNINNVGAKGHSAGKNSSAAEGLDEISEIGEFKLALRTLRTAAQFVCPWNHSFLAIEGFMLQNDFCMSELAGTDCPAATLTQFVDYILHENANRWRDLECYISTGELKGYWTSFSSARPKVLLKKRDNFKNQNQGSNKKFLSQFGKLPNNHPRINMPFTDACKAYNMGKCNKPAGSCTTMKGTPLKHICNYSDLSNPNAVACGQQHQAYLMH
jgi:hypothetical protein